MEKKANKLILVSNGTTLSVPFETTNKEISIFVYKNFPGCTCKLGGKA